MPQEVLVLDVGCGNGLLLHGQAKNRSIIGIDLSFSLLRLARQNNLNPCQGNINHLPFSDGQFDCVVCAEVIQHFDDLSCVLGELARITRPTGRILVSTAYKGSILRWGFRLFSRMFFPAKKKRPRLRWSTEVEEAGAAFPLVKAGNYWIYSPLGYIRSTSYGKDRLAFLASNFIVEFIKSP